jgi:hypothetical protein
VKALAQSAAQSKMNKGRLLAQIMVQVPIIPSAQRVVLPGARAALRLNTGQPEFYMRTADAREPKMELVRAKVKGNQRHLESLNSWMTGDTTAKRDSVSIESWEQARGVYRFTLSTALPPGEYAFAELTEGQAINLYVWDFGVDTPGATAKSKEKK